MTVCAMSRCPGLCGVACTLIARGNRVGEDRSTYGKRVAIDVPDDLDEAEDELSPEDFENVADQAVEQASTADTIAEMEAELFTLRSLEAEARALYDSGNDQKWRELSQILQDSELMFDANGNRRKIIIFTEHRDTLNYLNTKISGLLGRAQSVVQIHGGTNRDERRRVQEEFRQNKDVQVLLATDAAGEGVNLQNANLMVNYDLPWNPNRLEQRFGRIHRIGQREICHLWNLVADKTREGAVFQRLFEKIEIERQALGGRVFDVLGEAFTGKPLKDLLWEAIRYGEREDVQRDLFKVIDNSLDSEKLKEICRSLASWPWMSLASRLSVRQRRTAIRTAFSVAWSSRGWVKYGMEPEFFCPPPGMVILASNAPPLPSAHTRL